MKPKICGIATKSIMIKSFMLGNLQYMAEHGWNCFCLCSDDSSLKKDELKDVEYIPLDIEWGFVSPLRFFKEIKTLYKVFKRERFDVIQYAATNASLYAAIAGWMARVPVRINPQWGISYPIYKGKVRFIRKLATKLTCIFSTSNQPDSFSNLEFMRNEGLCNEKNSCVIYNGSACGVDLQRFNMRKKQQWKDEILSMYGINKENIVLGFVGRLVKEKGINELIDAFLSLKLNNCKLMLVGPLDDNSRINESLLSEAKASPNIIFTGPTRTPEKYFSSFNYMMLPSYQEGFGMTTLEAAALGVPAIVTNIKGPTDVVVNGVNGFICEVRSVDSLKETILKAITLDPESYEKMSNNAYSIVKEKFDSSDFKVKFLENRNQLLEETRK